MRNLMFLTCLALTGAFSAIGQASQITALILDDDQNIYVGSATGLSKMEAESRQMTHILGQISIKALAWSKRSGVLIGGNQNEIWTADGRRILTLDDPEAEIRSMMISGGQLWVGTQKGVYVISLSREKIVDHYTVENSDLPRDDVNTMYADGSGIKWIGTDAGVVRIEGDKKKWKVYEEGTKFLAIAGNIEGVWLAGDNEMWLVDPFNRWTPTDVTDGLSQGTIRSVATDTRGRIYVLSDVFVQFDPYENTIIPVDDQATSIVAQNVALAIDEEDQLWIATREDGLRVIDPEVEVTERILTGTLIIKHPTCAGINDGSIEVQTSGGRPPFNYYWNDEHFTGTNATGLGAGIYEVIIADALGNIYEDEAELIAPTAVKASVRDDDSAEGFALEATGRGGRGEYTYAWSSGQTTSKIAVEDPGTYTVTISDANGCTATVSRVVESAAVEPVIAEEEIIEEVPLDAVTAETIRELDATKLNVGQVLRIEQLQFQADSANIRPESYAVLDGISAFLKQNENILIEIGGHTNGLPDHEYCDRLSSARAKSVAEYLSSQGVPTNRISYYGYGKREPIATNETVQGRRKNQRVEVKILEL